MTWEKIVGWERVAWNKYSPRSQSINSKVIHVPIELRNEQASWYLDREKKLAKLKLEKDGLRKLNKTIAVPKEVLKALNEDQFIKVFNESGIYIGGYKAGSERIIKIMKSE
jgi:hypothetical protein